MNSLSSAPAADEYRMPAKGRMWAMRASVAKGRSLVIRRGRRSALLAQQPFVELRIVIRPRPHVVPRCRNHSENDLRVSRLLERVDHRLIVFDANEGIFLAVDRPDG